MEENGNGKERRRQDIMVNVLGERIHNIITERQAECRRYDDALKALDLDLASMRQQTHDWMGRMNDAIDKIPERWPERAAWALAGAGTIIGGLVGFIATHLWK